ncbi:hypothetical protein HGM15179_015103 [Zosterops borbonicus]|uniref:Uncharacterized protein n=1 Tax=Zosterops borbonicus TaxID=364589 RepID=A0A8K1G528_9PASS|nr:hypothetical protein HGM15179_015103 [Zosterops borbonicus]
MDPYKFIGPAGIHPRILKNLAVVITKPLSIIFERSWEPEEVPADWKLVNIVLILRKGKKEDLRNYRFTSVKTGKEENVSLRGDQSLDKSQSQNAITVVLS